MAPPTPASNSPHLDEAFYAMIASHFPAMDVHSNIAPGTYVSQVPTTLAEPPQSAEARSTFSKDGPPGSPSNARGTGLSQQSSTNAYAYGHRPTTSIYHPQPTRSGRIPVPPPEEELQAMLAMDNYFEFPSESESDDEDFVLPASELNNDDDEDEHEDDTPRNNGGHAASSVDVYPDNDGNWTPAIDSAEYDWLIDNLKALERAGPSGRPANPGIAADHLATTSERPVTEASDQEAGTTTLPLAPSFVSEYDSGEGNLGPALVAKTVHDASSGPPGSSSHTLTPAPSTVSTRRQPPPQLQSRQRQLHGILGRKQVQANEPIRTGSGSPKKTRTTNARKRARSASLSESTPETAHPQKERIVTSVPLADDDLEFKRRRNAEQSRTFRERQRAQREATAARMQELEDENDQLKRELVDLKHRLQGLEGHRQLSPTGRDNSAPRKPSSNRESIVSKPARKRATAHTTKARPPTDVSGASGQTASPALGTLSFEDLGKFVAGFVQAKSQVPVSDVTTADTESARSDSQTADVQHPLLLLTQLLSSQQ